MPAEQSSLQDAMARIMGAPAGGTPQTAGTPQQASDVQLAPQTPYSQELATTSPSTSLTIGNTPFDPYAEQAAQLAAMQAETAALNAQIAGGGTTGETAAAATGNPWDLPAATPTISKGQYYDPETGQIWVGDMWGSTAGKPMQMVTPTNINDPGIYRTVDWALGTRREAGRTSSDPATAALEKLYATASPEAQKAAFEDYGKYYYSAPGQTGGPGAQPAAKKVTGVATGAGGKPIYPGGGGQGIDWRVSAQYWKDLENWKKYGAGY